MPVPLAPHVTLGSDAQSHLASLVRAHSTPQALVFRCRLILWTAAPDHPSHLHVAQELHCHRHTVGRWRSRYLEVYNTHHAHPYRWTYKGQPLVRATPFSRTRRQQRHGRAWFSIRPKRFERVFYPPRPYKRAAA